MLLHKIDELFALLKGVNLFTALDLWSGYYHIKLDEESYPEAHSWLCLENSNF